MAIAADAIIATDQQQRIVVYNAAAEAMFGWERDEVLGLPVDRLLLADRKRDPGVGVSQAERSLPPSAQVVDERRSKTLLALRKDGEAFAVEASVSRLEDEGQEMLAFVLRDVSERRRAEEARRRSEERHRIVAEIGELLMNVALDPGATTKEIARAAVRRFADWAIIDLVREGGVQRPIVACSHPTHSRVAAELQDLELDRSRRHLMWESLGKGRPTLVQEVSDAYLQSFAQGERHLELLRALNPQSLITVPLVARGRLLGAVGFVVSHPRTYGPEALQLAGHVSRLAALAVDNAALHGSARRAVDARSEVLGVVAHDLKQPLNNVALTARLLRRGVDEGRCAAARATITEEVDRMRRLVDDMLDAHRLDEQGALSVDLAPQEPERIVARVAELEAPAARAAQVELRTELVGALPFVSADFRRLVQVFENLVGNAIRVTPSGGRVWLGARPHEHGVVLWVADEGPGIPQQVLPRVFDRFRQGRGSGRGSAGLGLAIVKGIVEAHGGRVWAESDPGAGATFCFTLPRAE